MDRLSFIRAVTIACHAGASQRKHPFGHWFARPDHPAARTLYKEATEGRYENGACLPANPYAFAVHQLCDDLMAGLYLRQVIGMPRRWTVQESSKNLQAASLSRLTLRGVVAYIPLTNDGGRCWRAKGFCLKLAELGEISASRVSDPRRTEAFQVMQSAT